MTTIGDEAPHGWTASTLGEIGTYLNGRAFKTSEWGTTGRPIIRIQDLTGSNRNPNYYDGDADERHVVRPGDLLISWSATLGAYIWDGPEAVLNQHIFKVISKIDQKFHFHLVRSAIQELERNAHGSGMVHVTKGVFESTPVLLPPAEEQGRIAARLDEIDARRTSIAGRLAAARTIVDRLRTAVLAAACSGRLTADWRHEHGGAPSEAPDGPPAAWEPTRLGDIVRIATGATPLRKNAAYYEGGTIPWITSGAVNAGIISEPTEMITPLALKETNVKLLPPGTLLIAMYGEGQTRGRVAELAIEAGTNQALAAIVFDERSAAFRPYLRLFFESGYQRMRAESFGGVQPNLSLGMFKEAVLPLPPLEEQREIVERAGVALATSDRLSASITSAERSLGDASRAALRRVFRGDLGSTEAGPIIAGDEPAREQAHRTAVAAS